MAAQTHEETVEELSKRLAEHKQQLATVESMLVTAPTDPTLLKLQADLRQVVAMTEDLTKMQGVPPLPPEEAERTWKEGDRCQALWEDKKWYNARIDSASELATYTVTYLEYGNTAEVEESAVRPYVPASSEQLKEGALVKAFWNGLFHPGVVQGPGTALGTYRIKFSKSKKKREIPAYDIVMRGEGEAHKGDTDDGKKKSKKALPDKFELPEHLIPKPSDSEKIREQKKKKAKQLKSVHRKRKAEDERDERKNTWLSFQKKGLEKKEKKVAAVTGGGGGGGGTGVGGAALSAVVAGGALKRFKKSIFASPDTVDGRVGVTGSGKTMSADVLRHKHYFPEEGKEAKPMPLPPHLLGL